LSCEYEVWPLLTVSEAADRLRLKPETAHRWLRSDKLRGISLASDAGWRMRESEVRRFAGGRQPWGRERAYRVTVNRNATAAT